MKAEDFVHLHNHSTYSLLEALPSPEEVVLRAKELGQTAVGLSDKGYMYGLVEFYQYATKHGLKPILGLDAYVAARTRNDRESGTDTKSFPLTLLAENNEGYQNLLQLATLSAMEGMYYKPRVDDELLTKYGKGLICLTGPITGAIGQAALLEDGDRIKALTEQYWKWFGKENVYYELMDLPGVSGQAEVNQQLIRYGKEWGVPTVATGNSHYCRQDDAEAHDILLCIQKGANVADPGRFSMRDSDFSMRPFEELAKAFEHVPEALENTKVIADRCNVTFEFGKNRIPVFPIPDGYTEESFLRELADTGFKRVYPEPPAGHRERLEYELGIIIQVGFAGYFLIVQDFMAEARRRGITVGPGRGSAAGSMVSYALGITGIDPMEHGLLFERFLNPERVQMPDIDLDFADNRRDEILEYVRNKYGADRVAQICTFGTLAARAAVKDVGRAYGISFLEMNNLAKMIPDRPGTKLKEALETTEMKAAYEENELYRRVIDAALKLEGKARHVSVHACGVIIAPAPTTQWTALQKAPKDDHTIITQYSAKPLESLGLLKMDFLGLMNLTVIQTALAIIENTRGETIDISKIPMGDKATYALLQRGDTTGVFQLESGGMRRYLKQLKPSSFDDITAMVSLYRPGPMDYIPSYIKRKHGQEEVKYVHDDLRPVLEPTFGIGIYQEQILQIAQVFAGFSLGEADLLRRAIGKKIKKELDAQREKFINGATAKGYDKKLAESIFDDVITPFAGYGFNKSHGAAYARIAYETAYLKANYTAEFMAALLTSDADDTERVTIEIEEARMMGIEVLPPDVNESFSAFTVIPPKKEDGGTPTGAGGAGWSIRFGLAAVKGVGEGSVNELIAERKSGGPFTSIEDFAGRLPPKILNKKLLESLAKAGALDSFAERRTIVEQYETVVAYAKGAEGAAGGQASLLDSLDTSVERASIEFRPTPPATPQQKLEWEKETLGLYVSSHPLAGLKKYISRKAQMIADLTSKNVGKKATLAGIVESVKKLRTKKGDTMAIVMLEDPTGKMEITLFPKTYADSAAVLEQPDTVLIVGGVIDQRAGALQMKVDAVKRSSLSMMIQRAKDEGLFDEEEAKRGLTRVRKEEDETVDHVDDEGNVEAGKKTKVATEAPIEGTVVSEGGASDASAVSIESSADAPSISLHTVVLPPRAPKQLLLDLKDVFLLYPGREKVQLKIGEQTVALPVTVAMSPLLQQRIDDVLGKYAAA